MNSSIKYVKVVLSTGKQDVSSTFHVTEWQYIGTTSFLPSQSSYPLPEFIFFLSLIKSFFLSYLVLNCIPYLHHASLRLSIGAIRFLCTVHLYTGHEALAFFHISSAWRYSSHLFRTYCNSHPPFIRFKSFLSQSKMICYKKRGSQSRHSHPTEIGNKNKSSFVVLFLLLKENIKPIWGSNHSYNNHRVNSAPLLFFTASSLLHFLSYLLRIWFFSRISSIWYEQSNKIRLSWLSMVQSCCY